MAILSALKPRLGRRIKGNKLKEKLGGDLFRLELAKSYLGLDIGSHSVKVAILKETGKGIQLVNLGMEEITPVEEADGERAKIEAIKRLLEKKNIKVKRAITALSGSSVNVNNLTVPEMPEDELAEGIRWEVEQYLPFSLNDANMDFLLLGEVKEAGATRQEVVAVATLKETVEKRMSLLEEVGLKARSLGVEILAPYNSFERSNQEPKDKVVALVNMGKEKTNISIFKEGGLRFTRDIAVAGDTFTSAIQRSSGLKLEEAERLKQDKGIDESSESYPAVSSVLDQLSSEVTRSLDYYKAQSHEREIGRLVLCGGGAKLKNLDNLLSESLGTRVEISTPFRNIGCDPTAFSPEELDDVGPIFTVAIGLALSGTKPRTINLLPVELRKEPKQVLRESLPQLAAGLAGFILFSVFAGQMITRFSLQRQKVRLTQKIEKGGVVLGQLSEKKKKKEELEKKREVILALVKKQVLWPDLLNGISEVIPEDVRLSTLLLVNEEEKSFLKISGLANSNPLAVEFILRLKEVPYFENIKLIHTKSQSGSGAVDFEIFCYLKKISSEEEIKWSYLK